MACHLDRRRAARRLIDRVGALQQRHRLLLAAAAHVRVRQRHERRHHRALVRRGRHLRRSQRRAQHLRCLVKHAEVEAAFPHLNQLRRRV
eukprot:4848282-Pleurochrysis_carterae.AAC.2